MKKGRNKNRSKRTSCIDGQNKTLVQDGQRSEVVIVPIVRPSPGTNTPDPSTAHKTPLKFEYDELRNEVNGKAEMPPVRPGKFAVSGSDTGNPTGVMYASGTMSNSLVVNIPKVHGTEGFINDTNLRISENIKGVTAEEEPQSSSWWDYVKSFFVSA